MSIVMEPNGTTSELVIDRFGRIHAGTSNRIATEGMLRITRQDVGVSTLVQLDGVLNHHTAASFVETMLWFERIESRPIHFDLSALRMIDVVGMRSLERLVQSGLRFAILVESSAMNHLRVLLGDELLMRTESATAA